MAKNYSYLALEIRISNSRFEELHEYLKKTLHLRDKHKDEMGVPPGTMSWQSKYHFTMRYCEEEIPKDKQDALKKELDNVLNCYAPVQLVLNKIECLPGKGDNNPVVITCKNVPDELVEMHQKLEDVLKVYAKGSEFEFKMHVTLGRVHKDVDTYEKLQAALKEFEQANPFWIMKKADTLKFYNVHCEQNDKRIYTEFYTKTLESSQKAKAIKDQKDEHDDKIRAYAHRNAGKPIIYVDMDNTIVDFSSALYKLPKHMIDEAKDGELDNIPGIYAIMDPIPNAIKSVNYLADKYDVYILSTSPWDNPSAWSDKLIWIKRYLGDEMWKKLILSHNKNLNRGRFLIDDADKNGAKKFGEIPGQEHIKIFSDKFPDWNSVVSYIDKTIHRLR